MKLQISDTIVVARRMSLAMLLTLPALVTAEDQYSDWSAPVNLGPPVNAGTVEQGPSLSKDGLSLYFSASNRPGGLGGTDIWVSQRVSVNDPWGEPENLGPNINTAFDDQAPQLTIDGHRLFFSSDRQIGIEGQDYFGGSDLYMSRRHNKREDLSWRPAVNLGAGVNSSANDGGPAHFEDDESGVVFLYFQSNRTGGTGGADIYSATLQGDETFGSVINLSELNGPSQDAQPDIRRDGLEILFNRGSANDLDLWVATRTSTYDPWSAPMSLGPTVNAIGSNDSGPELSFDGTQLYFSSTRVGGVGPCSLSPTNPCLFQLWVATRTKL